MEQVYQILCKILDRIAGFTTAAQDDYKHIKSSITATSRQGDDPQVLVQKNPYRSEVWIHNDGAVALYIAPFIGEVGIDKFSLKIAPNDTLVMNAFHFAQVYKNEIVGFWPGGTSTDQAMITEYSINT